MPSSFTRSWLVVAVATGACAAGCFGGEFTLHRGDAGAGLDSRGGSFGSGAGGSTSSGGRVSGAGGGETNDAGAGGVGSSAGRDDGAGGSPVNSSGGKLAIGSGGTSNAAGGTSNAAGGRSNAAGGTSNAAGGRITAGTGGSVNGAGGAVTHGTGGATNGGGAGDTSSGGAPPGTGGGAGVCAPGAGCLSCCAGLEPNASPTLDMVFASRIYNCACVTAACVGVCRCNSDYGSPSLDCVACMHAHITETACSDDWNSCMQVPQCVEFGNCAFGCL